MDDLIERVGAHITAVADEIIRPRFRALADHEVSEKAPDDLVTIADTEAETALHERLISVLPGVPVVGEEAVSGDASVLDALAADRVWIVDPIDGTGNFVAGDPNYGVMVALVDRGVTVAGWIHRPERASMLVAERGGGAYLDGVALAHEDRPVAVGDLVGAIKPRYLPPDVAPLITERVDRLSAHQGGTNSAAIEYVRIAAGEAGDVEAAVPDFVFYWMTRPWDHAAGSLIVEETGGWSRRLDGTPYAPIQHGSGLLVSTTPSVWNEARTTVFGAL
jgi:fructose-1,6-bisphosphatase/inositol monophosphatase family enzyme